MTPGTWNSFDWSSLFQAQQMRRSISGVHQQIKHPLFLPLFLPSNFLPSFLFFPLPSFPSFLLSICLSPFLPSSLPPHLPPFYLSPAGLSSPSLRLLDVDNEERFVSDQQFSNDRRFQLLQLRDQGVSHDTTTTI